MKKIWRMHVPVNSNYMSVDNLWIQKPNGICSDCGIHLYSPAPHIEVEWGDEPYGIGDFVFTLGPIVLRTTVATELAERFAGFDLGEVRIAGNEFPSKLLTFYQNGRNRSPSGLSFIKVTKIVDFHPKSTVEIDQRCDSCGLLVYKRFTGIERRNSKEHIAREPGRGFYFAKSSIGECAIFQPKHTGLVLCTEDVKLFCLEKGYSNVEFLEAGELLND